MDDELLSELQKEVEELRAFKQSHNALNKVFKRLEDAMHAPYTQRCDAVMSRNAFLLLGECLLELRRELCK